MKRNLIKISKIFSSGKVLKGGRVIRLESGKSLSSVMSSYWWKICLLSLKTMTKAKARIRFFHRLAVYLSVMTRRHGAEFTVKYLKASALAISKVLAQEPFSSLREIEPDFPLPRLTRSGLPRIIPTRDRQSILSGNPKTIRMYLSFFNLYRIISYPGVLKMETITKEFSGNSIFLEQFGGWLEKYTSPIIGKFEGIEWKDLGPKRFLYKESASPNCSVSWTDMIRDASIIVGNPYVFLPMKAYAKAIKSNWLVTQLEVIADADLPHVVPSNLEALRLNARPRWSTYLGRLAEKEEPAGKVRLFAIVDGWTQSLFAPLHQNISQLLRKLPNDGTFDQDAAFKRCIDKSIKFNCAYGYDLSAATDRLPLYLQVKILSPLIGKEAAEAWGKVLTDRIYNHETRNGQVSCLGYAVGQPMGALSSWNMLALTHHMIMQYASWRLNPLNYSFWETRYEILGDDIQIFDSELSKEYLRIMDLIGVPINEKKSVVSTHKPVVEFAKRTAVGNHEVTPLSWKQFISLDNLRGRLSLGLGLFSKDSSFKQKPLSVLSTVMKQHPWDKRIFSDSFALFGALHSYLFSKGKIRPLIMSAMRAKINLSLKDLTFIKPERLSSQFVDAIKDRTEEMTISERKQLTLLVEPDLKKLLIEKINRLEKRLTPAWKRAQALKVVRIQMQPAFSYFEKAYGDATGGPQGRMLERVLLQVFLNSAPDWDPILRNFKAGPSVMLRDQTIDSLYEIYLKLISIQSYYELADRLRAARDNPLIEESTTKPTEVLQWFIEAQKAKKPKGGNDMMLFRNQSWDSMKDLKF